MIARLDHISTGWRILIKETCEPHRPNSASLCYGRDGSHLRDLECLWYLKRVLSKTLGKQLKRLIGPSFRDRRYLIAVSGGVDSIVLADQMLALIPHQNLVFAHFDHRVRERSSSDAQFVERYSIESGVKMYVGGRQGAGTSENALRNERLSFLKKARTEGRCDFIVTAHHLDDQLETFFMRLARGAGIDGLSVMKPKNGRFLKPLLEVSKKEILRHAKAHGLSWVEDETNSGTRYFRNRIRNRLIPEWKNIVDEYGGEEAFYKRFSQTLREFRTVSCERRQMGALFFRQNCVKTHYWIRIAFQSFETMSEDEQSMLLRTLVRKLGIETLSRSDLKRLKKQIREQRDCDFPGFHLSHSCGYVFFQTPAMAKLPAAPVSGVDFDEKKYPNAQLRAFRSGDRLGKKKLKKLFLEYRIPKLERRLIPVLAAKGSSEVHWFLPMPAPKKEVDASRVKFPFSFHT